MSSVKFTDMLRLQVTTYHSGGFALRTSDSMKRHPQAYCGGRSRATCLETSEFNYRTSLIPYDSKIINNTGKTKAFNTLKL